MSKRILLSIEGMECPNCAMILERLEDKLEGVLMAEASYRKANMRVDYDETQVSLEQIEAAIRRMGYEVSSVQ